MDQSNPFLIRLHKDTLKKAVDVVVRDERVTVSDTQGGEKFIGQKVFLSCEAGGEYC